MERNFSVGDMARLPSNAQIMVVTDQMYDNGVQHCQCEWRDSQGRPHDRWYRAAALVPVERP
ncbi:hypothetical protein bAD24_I06480 [Burkholderia sp. AD24]|nr:hypothetical protein bAD24_I06480 [Burkholderia sp. AD24]